VPQADRADRDVLFRDRDRQRLTAGCGKHARLRIAGQDRPTSRIRGVAGLPPTSARVRRCHRPARMPVPQCRGRRGRRYAPGGPVGQAAQAGLPGLPDQHRRRGRCCRPSQPWSAARCGIRRSRGAVRLSQYHPGSPRRPPRRRDAHPGRSTSPDDAAHQAKRAPAHYVTDSRSSTVRLVAQG